MLVMLSFIYLFIYFPLRLCNGHNCRLILLRATCSLACVRQVSLEGGRLLACPAKAACSQLIAGTHLGRVSLAAARSLARFPSPEYHPATLAWAGMQAIEHNI